MRDSHFFDNWEKVLQKGRKHYALSNGIKYGVFLTIFINFIRTRRGYTFEQVFLRSGILLDLLILVVFGIFIFATFMWWLNNYFYNKR
ncbi:MAG: hypothetical protein Q4B43_06005 [Bacteroidota bacterium]|nr:hypothetical protein [Bacteroidota bacterium]